MISSSSDGFYLFATLFGSLIPVQSCVFLNIVEPSLWWSFQATLSSSYFATPFFSVPCELARSLPLQVTDSFIYIMDFSCLSYPVVIVFMGVSWFVMKLVFVMSNISPVFGDSVLSSSSISFSSRCSSTNITVVCKSQVFNASSNARLNSVGDNMSPYRTPL